MPRPGRAGAARHPGSVRPGGRLDDLLEFHGPVAQQRPDLRHGDALVVRAGHVGVEGLAVLVALVQHERVRVLGSAQRDEVMAARLGPGRRRVTAEQRRDLVAAPGHRQVGALDVQLDRFLAPVQPHEVARLAVHRPVVAAGEVADTRPLDLDDPGAQVGQLPGGERRRDRLLQSDDHDPRQRQRRAGRPGHEASTDLTRAPQLLESADVNENTSAYLPPRVGQLLLPGRAQARELVCADRQEHDE